MDSRGVSAHAWFVYWDHGEKLQTTAYSRTDHITAYDIQRGRITQRAVHCRSIWSWPSFSRCKHPPHDANILRTTRHSQYFLCRWKTLKSWNNACNNTQCLLLYFRRTNYFMFSALCICQKLSGASETADRDRRWRDRIDRSININWYMNEQWLVIVMCCVHYFFLNVIFANHILFILSRQPQHWAMLINQPGLHYFHQFKNTSSRSNSGSVSTGNHQILSLLHGQCYGCIEKQ